MITVGWGLWGGALCSWWGYEDIVSYLGFLVLALATLSFQHLPHNVTTNQSHNFAFIWTTAILIYSIIWCFKWRENFNNFYPPMKCNILLCFRLSYPLFHRILTEVKAKVTSVIMHLFPHQPPLSKKEGAYTWTPNWYHCDPSPLPLCTKREPHRGEQLSRDYKCYWRNYTSFFLNNARHT